MCVYEQYTQNYRHKTNPRLLSARNVNTMTNILHAHSIYLHSTGFIQSIMNSMWRLDTLHATRNYAHVK